MHKKHQRAGEKAKQQLRGGRREEDRADGDHPGGGHGADGRGLAQKRCERKHRDGQHENAPVDHERGRGSGGDGFSAAEAVVDREAVPDQREGRATQTLLMFVLGMLAGRYRLFYDEGRNRRIWGGLLAAGILGTWLVPFEAMRNLMTATAIVAAVVLLWYGLPGFRRALHGMTFFGRMSLTNYLLQSLLGTALFYNWGLGLYRHVDVIYGTLAGVGIILVQYAFCRIWLRRHSHGPVEWLWKKLTWLDIPFLDRKIAS